MEIRRVVLLLLAISASISAGFFAGTRLGEVKTTTITTTETLTVTPPAYTTQREVVEVPVYDFSGFHMVRVNAIVYNLPGGRVLLLDYPNRYWLEYFNGTFNNITVNEFRELGVCRYWYYMYWEARPIIVVEGRELAEGLRKNLERMSRMYSSFEEGSPGGRPAYLYLPLSPSMALNWKLIDLTRGSAFVKVLPIDVFRGPLEPRGNASLIANLVLVKYPCTAFPFSYYGTGAYLARLVKQGLNLTEALKRLSELDDDVNNGTVFNVGFESYVLRYFYFYIRERGYRDLRSISEETGRDELKGVETVVLLFRFYLDDTAYIQWFNLTYSTYTRYELDPERPYLTMFPAPLFFAFVDDKAYVFSVGVHSVETLGYAPLEDVTRVPKIPVSRPDWVGELVLELYKSFPRTS